jgi:hypothetical protein
MEFLLVVDQQQMICRQKQNCGQLVALDEYSFIAIARRDDETTP